MTTTKEEEENKLDDVEEEVTVAKTEKERAARSVDSVTNYVEEKGGTDVGKAVSALESLNAKESAEQTILVEIKPEDVQYMVEECEITKEQAERLLRKNKGDLTAAVKAYCLGQL